MGWGLPAVIIIGGGLLVTMYGIGIYNRLVTLANRFENVFSQIAVPLKRR